MEALVNLLGGIPKRLPVVFMAYSMPRDYYDPTDAKEHIQLVIGLDPARKVALTASRTTKAHAKGPRGVSHPPDPAIGMMEFGWWRIDYPNRVPYAAFDDDAVEVVGRVNAETERRLEEALGESGNSTSEAGGARGETDVAGGSNDEHR
jgi:hypothetical protein